MIKNRFKLKMGKENSKVELELNNNEKSYEFQVTKNNLVYNIKLTSVKEENIKITISFVLNQKFYIYEECFNPLSELNQTIDFKIIYQKLIEAIENKYSEIIHSNEEDNKYIILKIDINDEIKSLKLKEVESDDTIKLNELIKNYKSLEEKYIQFEKEKEKDNDSLKNNYDPDDNSFNNFINIDDNDNENEGYNNNNINNNINNNTEYENSDENHIILNTYSKIWCMLLLNKIDYIENNEKINLNLVALGFTNNKIILINLNTMKIHQEINTPNSVYSLAKFNDDSNYFIASFENGQMIIYKLNQDKFEQHQLLEKPKDLKKGEVNKVIILSDNNIATAERGALSIWKPNIELGEKKYELFKEIITNNDTCQLLEVNPDVFACAIYRTRLINIYKNDNNEYPLLGSISNVESHGSNSNGMAKINNNIFCSGGEKGFIYIVSVDPIQIIQKIILDNTHYNFIHFIHNSNDGFIFTSIRNEIIQYEIVTDNEDNFVKLEEFDVIGDSYRNYAIMTTNDGKIFYKQYIESMNNKSNLFLNNYKKVDN